MRFELGDGVYATAKPFSDEFPSHEGCWDLRFRREGMSGFLPFTLTQKPDEQIIALIWEKCVKHRDQ